MASIPPKVVHLTSVHYPFDTRIYHRECKSLAMAGYDVTLIAAHDSSGGVDHGVRLRTVPLPRDRRERITRTLWQIYRAALDEKAQVYHFHDPELIPIGVLLKLHGKRVIYDVHEDFKGTMEGKQWIPGLLKRPTALAISATESILGRACDRIVAATPTIARKFPPSRTRLVQNFPWMNELRRDDAVPYAQREPIAIYVGWLGDHSGVDAMTEGVGIAARERPVKLMIGGRVREGAKAEFLNRTAGGNVEFLGFLSRPQYAELMGRARMGLVTVLPTGNSFNAQPTKLFEYMSGGLPVIASDFPVYRKFVEGADCGLLVDPHRPDEIARAILSLLDSPERALQMGRNGRRAIEEKYNWENEAKQLLAAYEELLLAVRIQPQPEVPHPRERSMSTGWEAQKNTDAAASKESRRTVCKSEAGA